MARLDGNERLILVQDTATQDHYIAIDSVADNGDGTTTSSMHGYLVYRYTLAVDQWPLQEWAEFLANQTPRDRIDLTKRPVREVRTVAEGPLIF